MSREESLADVLARTERERDFWRNVATVRGLRIHELWVELGKKQCGGESEVQHANE